MPNESILNQTSLQQMNDDPFSIARQKSESRGMVLASSPVQEPTSQEQSFEQSLPQNNGQTTMNQALMKQIGGLGVDPTAIQMSTTGKLLLRSRLQQKYGAQYEADPKVKELLSKWDMAMRFYDDQVSENDARTQANGERTLAALKALG